MKIDPRHLMQLAAIVEAGGVTEGAALIGATQPALSRTVALLERRLGEPLFLRAKRPLQPTPLGRALAEQGARILAAASKASETADSFRRGEEGLVRIGGTPFFMDALIATMIASFQEARERVRVDQSYGYTADLIAQTRAGQIDLAICPIDVLEPDTDLDFVKILPGRNVIACRAEHPLRTRRPPRPQELVEFPWIAPPPMSPLNADLRNALLSIGADRIRISYSGGSLGSVVSHMRRSNCLTVLPHSVVFAMRKENAISALPIDINHPNRSLGILRRRGAALAPAATGLAAHIEAAFGELRDLIRRHEQIVIWGR